MQMAIAMVRSLQVRGRCKKRDACIVSIDKHSIKGSIAGTYLYLCALCTADSAARASAARVRRGLRLECSHGSLPLALPHIRHKTKRESRRILARRSPAIRFCEAGVRTHGIAGTSDKDKTSDKHNMMLVA